MLDIVANGFQQSLVLSVGVWSRKIRLDTGNRRIYLAPRAEIIYLPVVAKVLNCRSFSNGNGDHCFDCEHILAGK